MSGLTDYEGVGQFQINSRTLAEADTIRVSTSSNANPVTTMKKGFAGASKGAPTTRISVESAVPKGGMEQEWDEICVEGEYVTVTHLFAGRRVYYDGYIDTVDKSQGSAESAKVSMELMAGKPRYS